MDLVRNLSLVFMFLLFGAVSIATSSFGAELVWDAETGWALEDKDHLSDAERLYSHGRALFVKGETIAALDVFEAVEQKYPASPTAIRSKFARARCMEHLGRFEHAVGIYREIQSLPNNGMSADELCNLQIKALEKLSLSYPAKATEMLVTLSESSQSEEIRNAAQNVIARISGDASPSAIEKTEVLVSKVATDESLLLFNTALEKIQSCRDDVHDEGRLAEAKEYFEEFLKAGPHVKSDVARAYLQAIDLIQGAKDPEQRFLYYAMTYMPEERYKEACCVFKRTAKRFRKTDIGEMAKFQLAECFYLQGNYWKAFHAYEALLEIYPQSEFSPAVCGREFSIAEALLEQEKSKKAITVFKMVIANQPLGPLVDDAQMFIGRAYMKQADYVAAKESFVSIPRDFPRSEWSNAAIFLGGKADFLNARLASDSDELLSKARDAFELYLWEAPKGAFADEARVLLKDTVERQAIALLDIARFYEKSRKYQSAVWYYSILNKEYPDSSQAKVAAAAVRKYSSIGFRTP